jgi:serine/threonine-protein kinase
MSVVFEARDERLGRDVALKLLNPELAFSQEITTRFVNEARTLAQLDCPHVVRLFDAGVTDEGGQPALPFMALELLRGMELRQWVADSNGDIGRIVGWVLQICDGLAAAHVEGIVHRDLKPENLFVVSEPDGSQLVKVLDFGIARSTRVGAPVTFDGERMGSPGYMSPEQIKDARTVDERSDIWSLGVIMYELFTGVAPFQAESPLELCVQILNAPVQPIRTLRATLPTGLAEAIRRCMQRSPAMRFSNIADLADAMAPFAHARDAEMAARIRLRLASRRPIQQAAGESSAMAPTERDQRTFPPGSSRVPALVPRRRGQGDAARCRGLLAVAAGVGLVSFVATTMFSGGSGRSMLRLTDQAIRAAAVGALDAAAELPR